MTPHIRARAIGLVAALACVGGCAAVLGIDEPNVIGGDGGGVDSSGGSSGGSSGSSSGMDSGSGSGSDSGSSSGGDAGGCAAGARQCSGNGVAVCGTNGSWGAPVPCGSDTPRCLDGACTAPAQDGGVTVPPSCLAVGPGTSDCGPGGSGDESCCASLEVTGGTYDRTYANSGSGPTGEGDPATVSTLRLDRYEVTVGRFRRFVDAVLPADGGAGWLPAPGSGKHAHLNAGKGLSVVGGGYEPGWVAADSSSIAPTNGNLGCDPAAETWTPSPGNNEKLPITCTNWFEAYAFCIWDGGFLPSQAEWEYAAAGGGGTSGQREYPWGTTLDCSHTNYSACSASQANNVGSESMSGDGAYGQADLAGNVWEMNLDWYGAYTACQDCANLTSGTYRGLQGGGFSSAPVSLLPPTRPNTYVPTVRASNNGFRCARTP